MKVLVGIASYGEKNIDHLLAVIRSYREMPFDVRIVVLSEARKSQPLDAEVRVGLPGRSGASLPFAHKRLFAEEQDGYDVFIYTEDDIGVTVDHVDAFKAASTVLPTDRIPGFLRYEVAPDGRRTIPDAHGRFHWLPDSVQRHGPFVTAEFTNEHAGLYMVTQSQLKRALASGAYLCGPHCGRYGMLESAATDIYAACGMRKVVCVSHLGAFLVHHRPNRYVSTFGIPLERLESQVATLRRIARCEHPATTLLEVEPLVCEATLGKRYDESESEELLKLITPEARRVLSIGAGHGDLEGRLAERGHDLTILPLDSIVGSELASRGMRVVYGTLDDCLFRLSKERFDCIVASNILHLTTEPGALVGTLAALLSDRGTLVLRGPNPDRLGMLLKRSSAALAHARRPRTGRGPWLSRAAVAAALRRTGLHVDQLRWSTDLERSRADEMASFSGRLSARYWLLRARLLGRPVPCPQ